MTLIVKSGASGNALGIHNVSRVWFEDGRVWYCKEGTSLRLPYMDRFMGVSDENLTESRANTCISCGESIPEGRQVCPKCEFK